MDRSSDSHLGFRHLLVVLAVLAVLGYLGGMMGRNVMAEAKSMQMLSNMKKLQQATQRMAEDLGRQGAPAWPGDLQGSMAQWASALTRGGYLSTSDFTQIMSPRSYENASLGSLWRDWFPTPPPMPMANTNAILVYAARSNSPDTAVFLSSGNFTNTPTGGLPPRPDATPRSLRSFIVLRKGGDGAIYKLRQAGDTNFIGSFVPLCK